MPLDGGVSLWALTKRNHPARYPTGMISWIGSLFFLWLSVRLRQRCLVAAGFCLLLLLSTTLLHVIPMSNVGGSLANCSLRGFLRSGPQTFQSDQAPACTEGIVAMLVCYCVAILIRRMLASSPICPASLSLDSFLTVPSCILLQSPTTQQQ